MMRLVERIKNWFLSKAREQLYPIVTSEKIEKNYYRISKGYNTREIVVKTLYDMVYNGVEDMAEFRSAFMKEYTEFIIQHREDFLAERYTKLKPILQDLYKIIIK